LPDAVRFEVVEGEINISPGLPASRDNPPIGAIAECQIAILLEKPTIQLALFREVADNKEQQRFLGRDPQGPMRFI
jgi:hypothetical protein